MSKGRYKVEDIDRLQSREFFLDTNILIYIFFPLYNDHNDSRIQKYSKIYSFLRKRKIPVYIDIMVLREVIDKAIDMDYSFYLKENNYNRQDFSKKKYCATEDGQDNLKIILDNINSKILSSFMLPQKEYCIEEIKEIISNNMIGFVDKCIESICRENEFVLITHDSDFAKSDIEILSANYRVLN